MTNDAASKKRILVVDDDPMMGTTLRLTLEDDYDVEIASSAEMAMRILETNDSFDLILCDLMMPRVSGIDLHRWLTKRDANAGKKMLFMTGGAYTDEAARFLRDEADHHVEKPFRVDQLLARIETILATA